MQLKLSNNDLALALTGRDVGELRSDELQAEVAKLSQGERNIVEAWIRYREVAIQGRANETSVALAAFQNVVLESVRTGDAPGYGTGPQAGLNTDPRYKQINDELARLEQTLNINGNQYSLEELINVIDRDNGGSDGKIWLSDINHTAFWQNDGGVRDQAAEFLKNNQGLRDLLVRISGGNFGNGEIDVAKMKEHIAKLKQEKTEMENRATGGQGQPPPAVGGGTPAPGVGGGTPAPGAGSGPPPAAGSTEEWLQNNPIKLDMGIPTASDPLGRATERLSNGIGSIERQIDALMEQMGKESDPTKMQKLQAQLQKLERLMSMLTKMQERLMTMIQNLDKLNHDMTMNAIRNMK